MLKNISWQNFLVLIVWLLIAWYCFIGMVYYAKDIKKILRFKSIQFNQKQNNSIDNITEDVADSFARSKNLRDDIALILQKATQHKFPKEELVMALQLSVRAYPDLHQSAFQVAINHYISQESEKQCSTSFSDEELRSIWMG
jgi:competence CoiA-like predicted nuclease